MAGSGFLSGREPDSVRDHPFLRGRFRPAPLIAGVRSALSFDLGREAEFDALARRNLDRCARTGIASRAGGLVLHAEGSQTGQGDSFLFAQGLYRDADQSVHGLAGFDFRDIGVRAIASTSCVLFMAGDVVCGEARFQPVTKIRRTRVKTKESDRLR